MSSEEIRALREWWLNENDQRNFNAQILSKYERDLILIQCEIAAQLAEQNERFQRIFSAMGDALEKIVAKLGE